MSKEKSLVEDTFLQMKNLENVIHENAKGILASTMKEEIRSLVKESLNEQDDEEEIEVDAEFDDTDVSDDEVDNFGDEDEDELSIDADFDDEDEDDTIDLTGASAEDVLKVFKAMGPEDGVIVKKEDDMIHLSDENNDVDYFIQLSESEQEEDEKEMLKNDELEEGWLDEEEDVTETIYEIELDDEDGEGDVENLDEEEVDERYHMDRRHHDDDEDEDDDFELDLDDETDWSQLEEDEEEEFVIESKSNFKAKGVGMGNASKFKYDKKPNQGQGFKTKMKQGTRGVGMGKAKFEYKEGENMEKGKNTTVKKMETKEASRTLGNGSNFRKGGLPKPRAHSKANTAIKKESVDNRELQVLREKNEEYRNALNVFRDKLNEVAVFNSNLAYATRLFTEHSTTKQEKINILKRFDSVETLKESKNLYKSIKDELSNVGGKDSNTITESFERTVEKTPTSGSAVNLIESKTYENPQFLRMKDLMSKLK